MPSPIPAHLMLRADSSPDEVETREELARHLARGSLAGLIVQGLRLDVDPPDLDRIDLTGAVFVGCTFASNDVAASLVRRGVQVVPAFADLPYATTPGVLYTPDDLAAGFAEHGFSGMLDTVIYQHFVNHGGALPDVREALAQRLHDCAIDDALIEATTAWTASFGSASVVGVMGGHAESRGSSAYRLAATLGWRLAGAGRLIVTGGGPGVMEAANLGAYMSSRPQDELSAAIDRLAAAPDFHDHDQYTAVALAVRERFPASDGWHSFGGLSIPTWLYGHEPANLFAGRIAKYFSNAIREDTILRLARGGIVFAEGRAGTVQEVFQAATKTFYASDGASGPYVFMGSDFWGGRLAAPDLLRTLLSKTPSGDQSSLVHVVDEIDEAMALLAR